MPTTADERRNLAARNAWLSSRLRGRRPLVPVTGNLGTTVRVKLDPVGLLTALIVRVVAPVTIAGAVAEPARMAPYSLLSRIRLQDDQSNNRVVMTGAEAFAINTLYDRNTGQVGVMTQYPIIPTAIGTADIDVTYRIPIAADPWRDLRGSMFMPRYSQTYLFLDLIPALQVAGDDTAVYSGAAATITGSNATVTVWQEFIDGPSDLPELDLREIHYLAGAQSITSGLANQAEQLIDYPVQRSVRALLMSYLLNGVTMDADTAMQMRTIVRSNYEQINMVADEQYVQQRRYLNGSDLPPGFWFFTHSPEIFPRFSREYQAGFTPLLGGGVSTLNFCFDSFGS